MPKKPAKPQQAKPSNKISLAPLTPDQALRAVLNIGKDDVKRILASKPGKKK